MRRLSFQRSQTPIPNRANLQTAAESPTLTQPAVAGSPSVRSSRFPSASIRLVQSDPVSGIVDGDVADEIAGTVLDWPLMQDLNPLQTRRCGRTGGIGSSAGTGMARDDPAVHSLDDVVPLQVDLDPVCQRVDLTGRHKAEAVGSSVAHEGVVGEKPQAALHSPKSSSPLWADACNGLAFRQREHPYGTVRPGREGHSGSVGGDEPV